MARITFQSMTMPASPKIPLSMPADASMQAMMRKVLMTEHDTGVDGMNAEALRRMIDMLLKSRMRTGGM